MNWEETLKNYEPGAIEVGNIWSKNDSLTKITEDFISISKKFDFNTIATIETKGIIFAAAIAASLSLPLVVFRKKEKLHFTKNIYKSNFINWRNIEDGIEIEIDQLNEGMKLLVVDDLALGLKTFNAVANIVDQSESSIAAFVCFVNASGKSSFKAKELLSLVEDPKYSI